MLTLTVAILVLGQSTETPEQRAQANAFLRTLQTMQTPELDIWKKYSAEHASEIKPIGPDAASGGN